MLCPKMFEKYKNEFLRFCCKLNFLSGPAFAETGKLAKCDVSDIC
jgi:hypothetical protein